MDQYGWQSASPDTFRQKSGVTHSDNIYEGIYETDGKAHFRPYVTKALIMRQYGWEWQFPDKV
jgi:hypothetical protein